MQGEVQEQPEQLGEVAAAVEGEGPTESRTVITSSEMYICVHIPRPLLVLALVLPRPTQRM